MAPTDPDRDDERASFLVRFGTGVGAASVAAGIAVVPATLRVCALLPTEPGPLKVWLVLTAAALIPMMAAVGVLRHARTGIKAFAGPEAAARLFGLLVWLGLMFVVLSALAGVTFALAGAGLGLALTVACARLVGLVRQRSRTTRAVLVGIAGLVLLLLLAFAGIRMAAAFPGGSAAPPTSTGGSFVDALAFAMSALFASRPSLIAQRGLAIIGPPVATSLLVAGMWSLRGSSATEMAISEKAPLFSPAAQVLSGH